MYSEAKRFHNATESYGERFRLSPEPLEEDNETERDDGDAEERAIDAIDAAAIDIDAPVHFVAVQTGDGLTSCSYSASHQFAA